MRGGESDINSYKQLIKDIRIDTFAEAKLLIYKGCKVIPPPSLRRERLLTIRATQKSSDMTLRSARSNIWWPGLTNEVKQLVSQCQICKDFQRVQKKKVGNDGMQDLKKMKPLDSIAVDLGYLGIFHPFLVLDDKYSG